MSTPRRGTAAFEDLTARARIRDAALRCFTEHGFDRATIRGIARAAGVSAGLVRHHFGSKEELRAACDAHALQAAQDYLDQALSEGGLSDPQTVAQTRDPLHPVQQYLARALIDQSPAAAQIFDAMVTMTERSVGRADEQQPEPAATALRTRAAVMVAMALGIPAFRAHIARTTGADIFSPDGDRELALALLDIYSRPVLTPDQARALRPGLE
jgi:AcrR family transcriptional regulator